MEPDPVVRLFRLFNSDIYRLRREYREAISNDGEVEWVGEEEVVEWWNDEEEVWVLCLGEVERQLLVVTVEEEGWYGYRGATYL